MSEPDETLIERAKVREVAGVFDSPDAIDRAVDALQFAGFDRADVDVMGGLDALQKKLGTAFITAEELADVPRAPRRSYFGRDDIVLVVSVVGAITSFLAAAAAGYWAVVSGGTVAGAIIVALMAAVIIGSIGARLLVRHFRRRQGTQVEALAATGGLVLWVRVRTSEQQAQAQEVLISRGARAVRVHELDIEKRSEDLPLGSVRPDPWLGSEPLGRV
jgi:hypothetical protein